MPRTVVWFSAGAPSAVAAKLTLSEGPCTIAYTERPDDRQVFGYTMEEAHRADRFREQNPGVNLLTPLIDRGLGKSDCLGIVERAGIALPAMYQLGFDFNNCVGCPKGGMGYWNKIRVEFPQVFDRMAVLERELDAAILRVHECGPGCSDGKARGRQDPRLPR